MKNVKPQFGEIFYAVLYSEGNVQSGRRPVLIAQNDVGNRHSPTVEIIPMSRRTKKASYMPTHVLVPASRENGLDAESVVLAEQVQTINMSQLSRRIGRLTHAELVSVGRARCIQSPFPTN